MSIAFDNGRILTPDGFIVGQALLIDGERISALVDARAPTPRSATEDSGRQDGLSA